MDILFTVEIGDNDILRNFLIDKESFLDVMGGKRLGTTGLAYLEWHWKINFAVGKYFCQLCIEYYIHFWSIIVQDFYPLRSYKSEISDAHPWSASTHHVCSSLPLQQQHCWLYHRGILLSGLYVLIAFFERLWTSPLSIMSSFKEMRFDMTEQRECEGHGERRIPNVFLSFLILNSQKM